MQDGIDEPLFPREVNVSSNDESEPSTRLRIADLVAGQRYGVLCTQGSGQPYGSLVALAFSEDLSRAVFATPETTRKYRLLEECPRVALLIDDRPDHPDSVMEIEAITVTGLARRVDPGERRDEIGAMLLERHPYLEEFLRAPTCAVFQVDVTRVFHVVRFQEVSEWIPPTSA
jgi:nitroimidazol reductase NimA-like FMN-containing flavoprotein (pyridoxamine 5'-phosphate oxidase superfamily)